MIKKIYALGLCLMAALTTTAQTTAREEISQNTWLAGSNYVDYDRQLPDFRYTKPPRGYVPFYFSHYGRHGSRWLIGEDDYERVMRPLRRARQQGKLTREGQETLLGSHLSSDISAMFRHYAAHGFIPSATFADLYYATQSCYSDPTGLWGFPDSGEQAAAAVIETDESALNAQTRTASSRQYLGTALFRDGVCVGRLDGAETLCLNLLTRRVEAFGFEADGRAWALSSALPPRVRARRDGARMRIDVAVSLISEDPGDPSGAEAALARALLQVVDRCKALRVEPFGFAAKAAARFATLNEWRDYDWRSRFPEADVRVTVRIATPE